LAAYQRAEARLLKRASAVITTSPPYARSSKPLAPFGAKTHVVPLGLCPARLAYSEADRVWAQGWWGPTGLRALSIGRLAHYKGLDVLLRALPQVPDVQARLVGEGVLREELDQLHAALDLGDQLRFVGACSDPQRNALLASCDVLVLPSVERTEAFGVVLLEAMALGKPVIASAIDGSGPGWVVEHGRSGWHVNPRDVDALVSVLRDCARSPAKRLAFGVAGRARFEARFHIDAVALEIAAVTHGVLDLARGAA
jgi:rhamnosyl/mannosyltransferase